MQLKRRGAEGGEGGEARGKRTKKKMDYDNDDEKD